MDKVKQITVQELKQKMEKHEDFQLIDVREDFEYETSNLGGKLIPLDRILTEADQIAKDKPVIVMDRFGRRSTAAIMQLEQQFGYDNLYNLDGGIMRWSEEIDPSIQIY